MAENKALTIVQQRVAEVQSELQLADALVERVLVPGIDYGLHPGTRSQALKDPGANTLINAFNCYPRAEILFRELTESWISYVISVELISREDGKVKSTGTGSASTRETKYGYRWVPDPEAYGYDRAELKKRTREGDTLYRIVNPEWSELENTILKMARKRAEVDSAMALPGVARFIAGLNAGVAPGRSSRERADEWTPFWTTMRALGVSSDQVHVWLSVNSMKDWTAQGHTQEEAIRIITEIVNNLKDKERHD